MNKTLKLFATCPKNLEGLLEEELITLGAKNTKQTVAGVKFFGDIALAYRVCLWSRLANRVLLSLDEIEVGSADELYEGIYKIKWLDHLPPDGSLVVDFVGTSFAIQNSHFGALKVKDAIVDQLRKLTGDRPNIDKDDPDVRINVYLHNDVATVSVDLSGESLHRRGYRGYSGIAPLKENLAAAILYRSNWSEFAKQGKPLFDPMCGSGTILIEAAMMAQDYAPGLLRKSFGFEKWANHNKGIWKELRDEALERRREGERNSTSYIFGSDVDSKVIDIAKENIDKAGLGKFIKVKLGQASESAFLKDCACKPGIIITNPPYGKRLQDAEELADVYKEFGAVLRRDFLNWNMAMLTGNPELGKMLGIRSYKMHNFFNGTIPCKLLLFRITEEMFWREYKGKKS